MSGNCNKVLCGPPLAKEIRKASMGKIMFDCLKEGAQDIALIDAHTGNTLTYEEILQYSTRMAYNFKENGLKKNDIIVILSENNIHYLIPILAALYIGATAHPVNADMTPWELSRLFGISKPKWLFCSEKTLQTAKQLKNEFLSIEIVASFGTATGDVLSFGELLETNGNDLENFELAEVDPKEDVAYIFCSSGTTGFPKCVMMTHYGAVAAFEILFRQSHSLGFEKGDCTVSPIPMSHIYGFIYIEGSIITHVKHIIMKSFIPDLYLKSIELYQVNKISCPPALIKFLAESPLVDNYDLSSLKDVTCGSAPLQEGIDSIIKSRLNVPLRQIYGATEVGGACALTSPNLIKPGSCGTACAAVTIKISDIETKALLGCNEPGEICVNSPGVMKGYMNNPEETRKSFDNDGFYLTGDVGYYDEDGFVFIIDRLKDLIKYKGFQVSPTELEDLISKHSAVADVGVIGIPDERAGEVPLAYVVVRETYNQHISEREIVDFVAEHVNIKKRLHGGVKFVKEIPRNKNGKVLKTKLREIYNNTTKNKL